MRISGDCNDPAYWMKMVGFANFEIRCNGVPVPLVLEADEEAGTLTAFALSNDGKVIRDGDEMKTMSLMGKVEILVKAGPVQHEAA